MRIHPAVISASLFSLLAIISLQKLDSSIDYSFKFTTSYPLLSEEDENSRHRGSGRVDTVELARILLPPS